MNITLTTHRAPSARKAIVLAGLAVFLVVLFSILNIVLPVLVAAVLTIPVAAIILYLVALVVVPTYRPTRRR